VKKGLVFDLDGVLVDTENLHEKARREVYSRYDIPLEAVQDIPVAGRNTVSIFNDVNGIRPFGVSDLSVPIREKREIFVKLIDRGVALLPGIQRLLDYARARLKIGLGSSSTGSNVNKILDVTGIREYFDIVVVAEDVERVKPDPETFIKVLDSFGAAGGECVVFEDSRPGMKAGRAAGATVVGVKTGPYETDFDCADLVVENVEKGFDRIIELIEQ
jgi:HAD superfamily hydrolase (TIGR01509 family)